MNNIFDGSLSRSGGETKRALRKILLVDDDAFTMDLLANILEHSGYAVERASNGKEALEKYIADVFIDLIVSDINMPMMSGIELLRELRWNNLNVPVIMVTNRNNILQVMNALMFGAVDYVLKDENIQDAIVSTVKKLFAMNNDLLSCIEAGPIFETGI